MGWGADTRNHQRTRGGTLTPMGGAKSGCLALIVPVILAFFLGRK